MHRAARTLAFALWVGLAVQVAGTVRADGMLSYDRVVDVGTQSNPHVTYVPRLDPLGNVVAGYNPGNYLIEPIPDTSPHAGPDHFLGFTMHRAGETTNLLPPLLSAGGATFSPPNALGHIVGIVSEDGSFKPYFFSPETGQMTWLKSLPGVSQDSVAVYSINALDQIVGVQESKAILYASPSSEPVELASLLKGSGWNFSSASGINDRGEIAGYGADPSRKWTDFKLEPTAVPEPTSLATFAVLGALIVGGSRRRYFG